MMDISNIFQSIGLMILYSLLVLFVPSLVMGKKLSNQSLYERFMIYTVFGNFYIINVVFILQLIHISNRFTLIALYMLPILFVLIKPRVKIIEKNIIHAMDVADRLTKGSLGVKTFMRGQAVSSRARLVKLYRKLSVMGNRQNIEGLAVLALIVLVSYMYGYNSIKNYGYLASDIAVHNYWINAMSENNIFVAGVYPHGFHCVIYFLHAVFGIKTMTLLRLFTMTSAVYIHMTLWAFIRYITKSRYASYAAVVIYVAVDFLNGSDYGRYSCNLPQEFGMIFILPTLYFLFEYMKHERTRARKDRHYKARKWYELTGAAFSFSLTIAVHFYGTMILALFCVGVAVAYILRIFRPRFFLRLMAALIAGVVIAALPMGVSIAQGNTFQGSIGWGLSIISGSGSSSSSSSSSNENTTASASSSSSDNASTAASSGGTDTSNTASSADNGTSTSTGDSSASVTQTETASSQQAAQNTTVKKAKKPLSERIASAFNVLFNGLKERLRDYVLIKYTDIWAIIMPVSLMAVFIYGFVLAVVERKNYDSDYGCMYMAVSVGVMFVLAIIMARYLKLPSIMDVSRGRIYYMYMYAIIIGIVLDIIPKIMSCFISRQWIYNLISLVISAAAASVLFGFYGMRAPAVTTRSSLMQTNGAVYCLYKILDEHPDDDNWTIVSPTDELRMLDGRGYHYELNVFVRYLRRMTKFTIPTKYVYIYIEKVPLDYTVPGKYSGMFVSTEGASLWYTDSYTGNSMYKGDSRYIMMSKMYYWAKRYREVYPEDFTVYYEDDEFICYKLEQNTSFLNNLMVDFGYNR